MLIISKCEMLAANAESRQSDRTRERNGGGKHNFTPEGEDLNTNLPKMSQQNQISLSLRNILNLRSPLADFLRELSAVRNLVSEA